MKLLLSILMLLGLCTCGPLSAAVVAERAAPDSTADKMLLAQRISGGWPKQIETKAFDYNYAWSDDFISKVRAGTNHADATIDNHATSREIRHLVDAYTVTKEDKYLRAATKGVEYLLAMQYDNGGFPQFFPDTSGYRKHITFNDNAMLNAVRILKEVSNGKVSFSYFPADLRTRCGLAVEKATDCILKTQIRVNGKPAVWCAQHEHRTYSPAKARTYELPSFSGSESVDIIRFLMEIKNPSLRVKEAIEGGVQWLTSATLPDIKTQRITDKTQPKGMDVVVVESPGAQLWARFYDLQTGKPFFCGRDGVKKNKLSEIENERRTGYAFLGVWPAKLLSVEYPQWRLKNK
jgi:PelA/Pel-15E family pectate lyase